MAEATSPGMRRPVVRFLIGVVLAALCAGPLYLLGSFATMVVAGGTSIDKVGSALVLAVIAAPLGTMISFVPVLLSAALLGWAARRIAALRPMVAWLALGALAGTAATWLLPGEGGRLGAHLVMAVVGAVCAAICWRFTRRGD